MWPFTADSQFQSVMLSEYFSNHFMLTKSSKLITRPDFCLFVWVLLGFYGYLFHVYVFVQSSSQLVLGKRWVFCSSFIELAS